MLYSSLFGPQEAPLEIRQLLSESVNQKENVIWEFIEYWASRSII